MWPCLCCLRGRRKTSFKLALKKSLRHKMDLKMPKSELAIEEDPFLLMGKSDRPLRTTVEARYSLSACSAFHPAKLIMANFI